MIDNRKTRLIILGVLVLALGGTFVGFGMLTPNPQDGRYPGAADVAHDTDVYVGETVVVSGTVLQTDPLIIRDEYTAVRNGGFVSGFLRITVTDVPRTPDHGDTVQVYGTLSASRTVHATNVVDVPARNYLYMYGASVVAGLWVLGRLLKCWRLDWRHLRVVPRESPLNFRTTLLSWLLTTGEDQNA